MEEASPLLHTATIESPVLILLKDDLPAPSVTLVDAFAVKFICYTVTYDRNCISASGTCLFGNFSGVLNNACTRFVIRAASFKEYYKVFVTSTDISALLIFTLGLKLLLESPTIILSLLKFEGKERKL